MCKMGLPLALIVVLIFAILIIVTLISVLVYFIFFHKVELIAFGNNGLPPEIMRVKKSKGRLWGKNFNLPIIKNYVKDGKKIRYFAIKIDDSTYVPYNFLSNSELEALDEFYNSKINDKGEEEKEQTRYYGLLPKFSVDFDLKAKMVDSCIKGMKRFQFGFDKIAPFAVLVIFVVLIVIGTIMSIKYNTEMTPAHVDTIRELGDSMQACSQFISEGQQVNAQLLESLQQERQQQVTIPD